MRRGWLHLASGAGLGRVFGFASNLLLSRWLGPSELGLFNLVTTTVQTSDTLVRCGGDYALNYELGGKPEAVTTEHGTELARGFAQICSLMTVFVCLGFAVWIWPFHGLLPTVFVGRQRVVLACLLLFMIACEGITASAWEVLLVSHRTALLALRQALYVPLRLSCAALGAFSGGVAGAMLGWSLVALVQCLWLKKVLGHLWQPLQIWTPVWRSLQRLLRRGLPFYAANLVSSIIFYPLLLSVAHDSGLSDIGYLRIGQILQQLFAFLPTTLVPVLFLKLRSETNFASKVFAMERPLRIIWFLLLEVLLIYCIFDQILISWLFGATFTSALLPTRLLLVTALLECVTQLVTQPLLAEGQIRLYSIWQCGSAIIAAILGWLTIPSAGLSAYLIVRLLYVILPLIGFGVPVLKRLREPSRICTLVLVSIIVVCAFTLQAFLGDQFALKPSTASPIIVLLLFQNRKDAFSVFELVSNRKA